MMSAHFDSTSPVRNTKWRLPAVHPEGRKYVVVAALLVAFFWIIGPHSFAWPMVGVGLWLALFFRDPVRVVPVGDDLILAPADGLVMSIETNVPPRELADSDDLGSAPFTCVSIFVSIFDAHIQRAPMTGVVRRLVHVSNNAPVSDHVKSRDESERQHWLIVRSDGVRVGFTQVATFVARRVLAFAKPGDMVVIGQRVGLIRFASRVNIYLPANAAPRVVVGQRAVAGETILAVIGMTTPAHGIAL